MNVLPASWQHQVGHHAEQPFAGSVNLDQQQQQPPQHDTNDRSSAARLSFVPRLAEYHLAVPAPAASRILQLVSQAGLEFGDFLMLEPGTMQQEMNMVVDFGSIILGAPLRHDHARGAQIMFAAPQHQPATAEQRQVIRNEARRHHQPQGFASQGAVSDSLDSLDGFVVQGAWSEIEKEHQEERYRRKARETRHAIVRPLPAPPVVSQTIKQPDKFHCPALPARGAVEQFEERLVAEFRAFTSLGEAAEAYIRRRRGVSVRLEGFFVPACVVAPGAGPAS